MQPNDYVEIIQKSRRKPKHCGERGRVESINNKTRKVKHVTVLLDNGTRLSGRTAVKVDLLRVIPEDVCYIGQDMLTMQDGMFWVGYTLARSEQSPDEPGGAHDDDRWGAILRPVQNTPPHQSDGEYKIFTDLASFAIREGIAQHDDVYGDGTTACPDAFARVRATNDLWLCLDTPGKRKFCGGGIEEQSNSKRAKHAAPQ